MRFLIAPLILLATAAAVNPLFHFKLESGHSSADAHVPFMGIADAKARFPQMMGEVTMWPDRPEAFEFHVEADARAIEASNGIMTRTLKGPDFFNAEKFPTITFDGTHFTLTSDTKAKVTGDLTARGVTRPVSMSVIFASPPMESDGHTPIDFTATTQIDRREFGMKSYPVIVGNIVHIAIKARMLPG